MILPGAEPYSHDGGPIGALLIHGFTGCPQSLRPWAEYLAAAGLTVRMPLLPGHGRTWQELNATRWPQWYAEVEAAHTELTSRCGQTVVMGLSFGAALALHLAIERPDDVRGLVLVNTFVLTTDRRQVALPALRWITGSVPGVISDIKKPGVTELGYDRLPLQALYSATRFQRQLRGALPRLTQPLLLYRSAEDHVVPAASTAYVLRHAGSPDIEEIMLPNSYHVATLDNDAEEIFAGSLAFVRRLATRQNSTGASNGPVTPPESRLDTTHADG